VCAKFIVITGWCAALTVLIYLIGLGVGIAVGLPPASLEIILQGGITLATSGMLTVAIIAPIIFFASAGHGYLPPMGVAILVVGLAQLVAVAGWGEYFPWAIPGLVAQGEDLGITSYMIVIFTSIAGIAGTFLWWELADQSR
jgi:ABC-2 type transport system permease protein